jgi:LmbE family N-acetylglucosaminyl deacetylase
VSAIVGRLGTLVGVWAHPDDEAYLSAGLMAAAAEAGIRVVCVTATRGELGTSDPARCPPARLALVRERELERSLAVLGVTEHVWLPYEDGQCAAANPAEAVATIREILDDVGAATVVTFGRDGMTGHPDHVAVGEWAMAAARSARRRPRVLHATKTVPWAERHAALHRRVPVFGVDGPPTVDPKDIAVALELRGADLDRKVAALLEHTSQVAEIISVMGAPAYHAWVADEYFVDRSTH